MGQEGETHRGGGGFQERPIVVNSHDALMCVHTHSQHALSRQARTKQTSVTLLKIMVIGGRTQ